MLSRTAENLYWTARYIERADSIARLLEVAYRIHLIPNTSEGYQNEWESILAAAGIKHNYLNTNNEITKNKIEYFLLFDPNNSSSVKACIENARNNLKMVRTAVTLEVWNAVNTWYHELVDYDKGKYDSKNLPQILDFGYHLFFLLLTKFQYNPCMFRCIRDLSMSGSVHVQNPVQKTLKMK